MLRLFAVLVGLTLIAIGAAPYLPEYTQSGLLFGYFRYGDILNVLHLATGVIALLSAISQRLSKTFLFLFGLGYSVLAVVGLWRHGNIYAFETNGPVNLLHLALGVFMLLIAVSSSVE